MSNTFADSASFHRSRAHKHMPVTAFFQTLVFKAFTGNALTTVLAGLAFTITTFPKTSLFPALVAAFWRVLIMQMPGKTNFPALFTCSVATPARVLTIFMHSDLLSSVSVANASARPPLVIAFAPAFIDFMGAMMSKGHTDEAMDWRWL